MSKRLAGFGLAFCLLAPQAWAGPDPVVRMSVAVCDPNNPARCLTLSAPSAPINISTATTTKLVAGVSGKSTLVLHWDAVAAGTGNLTLEYGTTTTTACDTGAVALTGPYPLAAQARVEAGNGQGEIFALPAGADLCAVTSAAVQYSGSVTYMQN